MAEIVVDVLEVVDVDEQHRNDLVRCCFVPGVVEALEEETAIREVGHRIVQRIVQEQLLGDVALPDVPHVADVAADGRVVEQVGEVDFDPS